MLEPYGSLFSRFIYTHFHHESYDESVTTWNFPDTGPLSSSNQTLPKLIFHRDKKIFEQRFLTLKLHSITYHTFLQYLVSGGLSRRQLLPSFMHYPIRILDMLLQPFMKHFFAMFHTIVLEKCIDDNAIEIDKQNT